MPSNKVTIEIDVDGRKVVVGLGNISDLLEKIGASAGKGASEATKHLENLGTAAEQLASRSLPMAIAQGEILVSIFEKIGEGLKSLVVDSTLYAARTQVLGTVLQSLARVNHISYGTIVEQEQAIKKLGITTQEARQSLTKMIQAQLDTAQTAKLARVAQDAAVIGNMNSSEALDTIIHGITSLNTRVLHNIGIMTDAHQAEKKYADALHITTAELTPAQKQQAILNDVLERGKVIAGTYEAAMGDAGKQMTSLKRHVEELQNSIGEKLLPAFTDIIHAATEFLKYSKDIIDTQGLMNQYTDVVLALAAAWLAVKVNAGLAAAAQAIAAAGGVGKAAGAIAGGAVTAGWVAAGYEALELTRNYLALNETQKETGVSADKLGADLVTLAARLSKAGVQGVKPLIQDMQAGRKTADETAMALRALYVEAQKLGKIGQVPVAEKKPGEAAPPSKETVDNARKMAAAITQADAAIASLNAKELTGLDKTLAEIEAKYQHIITDTVTLKKDGVLINELVATEANGRAQAARAARDEAIAMATAIGTEKQLQPLLKVRVQDRLKVQHVMNQEDEHTKEQIKDQEALQAIYDQNYILQAEISTKTKEQLQWATLLATQQVETNKLEREAVDDATKAAVAQKHHLEQIKLQQQQYRELYDKIHGYAEGVFDAITASGKRGWKGLLDYIHGIWLTQMKKMFADFVAHLLTPMNAAMRSNSALGGGTQGGGGGGGLLGSLGGALGGPSSSLGGTPPFLGGGTAAAAGAPLSGGVGFGTLAPGGAGGGVTGGGGLGAPPGGGMFGGLGQLFKPGAGFGGIGGAKAGSFFGKGGAFGNVMVGAGVGFGLSQLLGNSGRSTAIATAAGGLASLVPGIGPILGPVVGAAVAVGFKLWSIFHKGREQKFQQEILRDFGINVTDKGILQHIKQLGEQQFGKNADGKRMETLQSDAVQGLLLNYATQTGQDPSRLPLYQRFYGKGGPSMSFEQSTGAAIPKFQQGGVIRGGLDSGRDNLLAMYRPGERVLTPEVNKKLEAALAGGTMGGGPIHIEIKLDTAQHRNLLEKGVARVAQEQPRIIGSASTTSLERNYKKQEFMATLFGN